MWSVGNRPSHADAGELLAHELVSVLLRSSGAHTFANRTQFVEPYSSEMTTFNAKHNSAKALELMRGMD